MPKVWVGAWALESELAEAEERRRTALPAPPSSILSSPFPILFSGEPSHNFPSLHEANTNPQKKKPLRGPAEKLDHPRHRNAAGGGNAFAPPRRLSYFNSIDNSRRRADEVDSWISGKKMTPILVSGGQERLDNVEMNRDSVSRPREEVLEEKGLDWRKIETEIELKKGLSPASPQSSRSGSCVSCLSGEGAGASPRIPKVNPFGNAKPREVVLEEKGMDWRKIDMELEHRGVDRPETDEEKILKEEIDRLRDKFAKETERQIDCDYVPSSSEQISSLLDQIGQREKELTQLIRDLDDKVRFRRRASMKIRPSTDSGRIRSFANGPPSQSGSSSDSKYTEFTERPPSQDMDDKWSRSLDDRCGFQRRNSGFLASRSLDRSSKISERWW